MTATTACPSPNNPVDCGYIGDSQAPIQAELVGYDDSSAIEPLPDGGLLQIIGAPQGGYIFYAGAYARNLNGCGVTLSAELVDPVSGAALTNRDQRQADLTKQEGAFEAPADLQSELPNIPACPDALGKGIAGAPALLRVTVSDADGKTATFMQAVHPFCAPGDVNCHCICGPSDGGGC